jgi:hypothetical protein
MGENTTKAILAGSWNSSVLNLTNLLYKEETLQRVNDERSELLTPVIAFLCLLMVFGILGNLLVLYVYEFRFKRSSSRTFILCLALLDFVACVIGMPYHIYDMYHTFTYYEEGSCKGLSYILGVTVTASSIVLTLIAIDRYRKICQPFGKQISDLGTKKACFASVFVASLISIPNIIMYGNASIEVDGENFTGVECYIKDEYGETAESYVYFGLFFLLFMTTTIVLVILYSLVGIKIRKRATNISNDAVSTSSTKKERAVGKRKSFSFCGASDPETTNEILSETDDSLSTIKVKTMSYKKGNDENNPECKMEYENAVTPIFKGVIEAEKDSNSSQSKALGSPMIRNKKKSDHRKKKFLEYYRRQTMSMSDEDSEERRRQSHRSVRNSLSVKSLSKRQKRTVRITGMLFMITLIYVISFLPHLVLLILEFMDPVSFENLSPLAFTGYNFLLRSYFINNIANPFVYGFLDPKFRYEVLFLCKSIMNCKHKRIFRH